MKVLVTGASGFVGKALVRRLLKQGHQVTCLGRSPDLNLFTKERSSVSWLSADLKKPLPPPVLDSLSQFDEVYHLAGLIAYQKAQYQEMMQVNVHGTENLLTSCIAAEIPTFYYLSSVVAIGANKNKEEAPRRETDTFNLAPFAFGYFDSKHLAEKRVIELSESKKIRTLILNPSTIYGPEDALKGSRKSQVKVAAGRFPFSPKGGVNVVHLDDVLDSFEHVKKWGRKNQRYIIANQNLTIEQLFQKIAHFAKVPAPRWVLPTPALLALGHVGDAAAKYGVSLGFSAENARVASLFHWFDAGLSQTELKMNYRSSDQAIEDSVRWILDHLKI